MSQPKKAFNEVRAILGKLDRSREELRQRTPGSPSATPAPVTPPPVVAAPVPATFGSARPGVPTPGVNGTPTKAPTLPPTPGSRFGRAQPIRPGGSDALGRWNPPGQ